MIKVPRLLELDEMTAMQNRVNYPDPPRTRGLTPDRWPTSATMTDDHLLRQLERVEIADRRNRLEVPRDTHNWNVRRMQLNGCMFDLQQEAFKRGLRSPYQEEQ